MKFNKIRRLYLWLRRYVRKSKPSEWITSCATLLGVIAVMGSGYVAYHTGFIDAKRERLESTNDRLQITAERLRLDQKDLENEKAKLRLEVEGMRTELEEAKRRYEASNDLNKTIIGLISNYERALGRDLTADELSAASRKISIVGIGALLGKVSWGQQNLPIAPMPHVKITD